MTVEHMLMVEKLCISENLIKKYMDANAFGSKFLDTTSLTSKQLDIDISGNLGASKSPARRS